MYHIQNAKPLFTNPRTELDYQLSYVSDMAYQLHLSRQEALKTKQDFENKIQELMTSVQTDRFTGRTMAEIDSNILVRASKEQVSATVKALVSDLLKEAYVKVGERIL